MKAKEMFYKLGFDLVDDSVDIKKYVFEVGDFYEVITFLNRIREVRVHTQDNKGNKQPFATFITLKRYQAINQQMKELGWL